MYDPKNTGSPELPAFRPVPSDRSLTKEEKRMTKFAAGEIVYVKGIAMRIQTIEANRLILVPPSVR